MIKVTVNHQGHVSTPSTAICFFLFQLPIKEREEEVEVSKVKAEVEVVVPMETKMEAERGRALPVVYAINKVSRHEML